MVNTRKLYEAIAISGLKLEYICSELNLSYSGFRNKARGTTEFLASEIYTLTQILNLTEKQVGEIFLSNNGNK